MNPQQTPPQPPQKLVDFNTELKALCDKYQYEMIGKLNMFEDGLACSISVKDKSPLTNKGVSLTPQVESVPESAEPTVAQPVDVETKPVDNPAVN